MPDILYEGNIPKKVIMKKNLLIIDDDERLRDLLKEFLLQEGYTVCTAESAKDAKLALSHFHPDLLILDVMMPGQTGIEFLNDVRRNRGPNQEIPVLILSAMGTSEDRILGLETGADDYLVKPFEPRELILRIENIFSRFSSKTQKKKRIDFGARSFDILNEKLFYKKTRERIALTSAELVLLKIFSHSLKENLSREYLAEKMGVRLTPRTIDVQVTRLRRKIEDDPKNPQFLRTIRHQGYALWADSEDE